MRRFLVAFILLALVPPVASASPAEKEVLEAMDLW